MKSKNIHRFILLGLAAVMLTTVIIYSCNADYKHNLTKQTVEAVDVTDKVCVPIVMYHHVLKKAGCSANIA